MKNMVEAATGDNIIWHAKNAIFKYTNTHLLL